MTDCIKRQQRAERKVTGNTPGVKHRMCIEQEVYDIGTWPSGQPMQRVRYLHLTKGWRDRLLQPALWRRFNTFVS